MGRRRGAYAVTLSRLGRLSRPIRRPCTVGMLAIMQIALAFPVSAQSVTTTLFATQQVSEMQAIVADPRYAGVFGGLWADPSTGLVTISVASTADAGIVSVALADLATIGTSSDPLVTVMPKTWTVRYEASGPSLATLGLVFDQLRAELSFGPNSGSSLVSFGINPKDHVVDIGVDAITPELTSEATSAFGSLARLRVETRPLPAAVNCYNTPKPPRCLDKMPYYGGDRISTVTGLGTSQWQGIWCSSGFEAWDPATGHTGMLTSGHCWPLSTTVQQGYVDEVSQPFPNWPVVGTGPIGNVTRALRVDRLADAEFIDSTAVGATVDDRIYTSATGTSTLTISGYGSSFVGMTDVCFAGSVTVGDCTGVVEQINYCHLPQGLNYWICDLTLATASDGTAMCDFGDSGGPVYVQSGGSAATAYGLVQGFPNGGSTPSASCYYAEITPALAQLDVGLVTTSGEQPPPLKLGDSLYPNETMSGSQFIDACSATTCDTGYQAVMQGTDGNFVLYWNGVPKWWTGAKLPTDYLLMQGDGNLVMYRQGGRTVDWSSGTYGNNGAWLVMQNDGNLVIYRQGGVAIWHRP